jgi:spermidine/putrescine transport system substrate-binding protein
MRSSRRRFLKNSIYAASAFTIGTTVSSCGLFQAGPPSDPTDPANTTASPTAAPANNSDDRTLFIYGWANYVTDRDLFKEFTKATGIKVEGESFDSNEVMLARLQASGNRAAYGIIYPSDYMVTQMIELDLLTELDKDQLTNLKNLDQAFLDPSYDPGSAYSLPISLGTTGLAYNSAALIEEIGAEPEDWQFLWEHIDRLRLTLLNDPREVMGMALHTLDYSYNSEDETEILSAFERLQKLKPTVAKFDTYAWAEPLMAGDYLVSMAYSGDGLNAVRQNPDIKYILPASGTSIWTDAAVIPKTAPDPEAAYAWLDFILQPEIAARMSEESSYGTANKAALPKIKEDLKSIPAWLPSEEILAKSDRLVKLPDEVLQIYENYWTRLTTGLG